MKKVSRILLLFIAVTSTSFVIAGNFSTDTLASSRNNQASDDVFYNYNAMSQQKIQTFINGFSGSCLLSKNYPSGLSPVTFDEPKSYFEYGADTSPARIIWNTSQLYKINPQILLATLEKEQNLVTGGSGCAVWKYNSAMGYNCPDGSENSLKDYPAIKIYKTCVAKESNAGFSRQVNHAAWQLSFDGKRANGNLSWMGDGDTTYYGRMTKGYRARVNGGASTYYDGYTVINGQSVYLQNGPTAALYNYTPHFSNFTTIFTNWFGDPSTITFQAMSHSRYLRLDHDVRKTNVRTGQADGALLPKGMEIYFSTSYTYQGELYLRTAVDTAKKLERGIRYSDLDNITPVYKPLSVPRWIEMDVRHTKVDPVTEESLGGIINPGEQFFFTDKVVVGDRLFLRTQYNAEHDHDRVIPFDMLKDIPLRYQSLSSPRWMVVDTPTKKVHPTTNVAYGATIPSGTKLYFDSLIRINGKLMLRTKDDTKARNNLTLPYDNMRAPIDFKSMYDSRYLRLKDDVKKTNFYTGEDDGVLLPKDMEIYFSTRYIYKGELYVRTKSDTNKQIDRGIRYSDLEAIR